VRLFSRHFPCADIGSRVCISDALQISMSGGPTQPTIGARVLIGDRHKATVRYFGPLDGQTGDWVGLEWDEPSRGKHDGSHNGKRYFRCSGDRVAGSFLRLPKFMETANEGCTLLSAVRDRYGLGSEGAAGDGVLGSSLFYLGGGGARVGKQSDVGREGANEFGFQQAGLVGMAVAHLVRGRAPTHRQLGTLPTYSEDCIDVCLAVSAHNEILKLVPCLNQHPPSHPTRAGCAP
jgi:hypothetical protein